MDYEIIKGLVIGLSIAAPVGPIGLLCIRRTLAKGKLSGLATGLGAATADMCYGIVAAFGLAGISNLLLGQKAILQLIGGIFLIYLGVKTFVSKAKEDSPAKANTAGDYLSTLGLTLSNPVTIMSFIAIFAGLGFASADHLQEKVSLIAGVFLGSLLWWVFLTQVVGAVKHRLSPKSIELINKISGIIILAFGVLALAKLL